MQERLLHFIWKHQYFDAHELYADSGEQIQIIYPGRLNTERGPDFLDAEIQIDGIRWRGSVEIHVNASSWKSHGHQNDPVYNNVILHVTWEPGEIAQRRDGTVIPSISLMSRTPTRILDRYHELLNGLPIIPCSAQIDKADPLSILHALDSELQIRIVERAREVFLLWNHNGMDWEQTAFEWLVRHFGFSVNNESFALLGASLPYRILWRHRNNPLQVEALVFGMAGMLFSKPADLYQRQLSEEFRFLKYKYNLHPRLQGFEWKFLRLRPSNFPTVRLAQLSAFVISADSISHVLLGKQGGFRKGMFSPGEYWHKHYKFGKIRSDKGGEMGRNSQRQLFMNSVIPLRWAYYHSRGDSMPLSQVYTLLHSMPAENNRITRLWNDCGVNMQSTLDTQAYHALFRNKCSQRKCLDCPVGINLLKTA